MNFSIIIVSWNVCERLQKNLNSIFQTSGQINFEVIVIDNNSTDETLSMIKSNFPQVHVIANDDNLGFAKACNQGLKIAQGKNVILLNPDMQILPDTLINLDTWLKMNPQADVAGIKLFDSNHQLLPQIREFPTVWSQLAIVLKLPHLFPQILSSYLQSEFDYTQAAQVDSLRGAFFVLRRSTLEQFGYFDERYFLWFEEVDYCRTVKAKGGQVWYTPVATAIDYVGQSFSQLPRSKKQKIFRQSMLAYFKKWESSWQVILLVMAWELSEAIVRVAEILRINPRSRT
jgi:GT2 family glycosyltransferase